MKPQDDMLKEIPKSFYSFETNTPFERCIECDKELLRNNSEYLIERVIRNYKGYSARDVIFDYAICMDCVLRLQRELSTNSKKHLAEYFHERLDREIRKEIAQESHRVDDFISKCLVTGANVKDVEEYQICAHCVGNKIYMGNPPYMLSESALNEIMGILSASTTDLLNGFYQKHFSPSPGIFEPDPKIVLF